MRCNRRHSADFNPRPPRGGRQGRHGGLVGGQGISIHAPREGGDAFSTPTVMPGGIFQSTPPARGATRIQLHGLLRRVFQSTPPARGATAGLISSALRSTFQSTPPARGATLQAVVGGQVDVISIPAPREGGDDGLQLVFVQVFEFQSTPPARGATVRC